MSRQLTSFIKGLATKHLLSLFNLAQPSGSAPVKKFADRPTAEKRMTQAIAKWDGATAEDEGYANFFGDFAAKTAKLGFELPAPVDDAPNPNDIVNAVMEAGKSTKAPTIKKERKPRAKKDKVGAEQLNLRCPECDYFAKTDKRSLALGRLVCPVHPKQVLQTKEERGEKRGIPHGQKS